MKKIYILFFIVFLSSCRNENKIEIQILSDKLQAYCIDDSCSKDVLYSNNNYKHYFKKSINRIRIKVTNKSNSKKVVLLNGLSNASRTRALFFDNFYTSVQLLRDLIGKGIRACGTIILYS